MLQTIYPYVYCQILIHFSSSLFNNLKKIDSQNVATQMDDFERRLCAQTQFNCHSLARSLPLRIRAVANKFDEE